MNTLAPAQSETSLAKSVAAEDFRFLSLVPPLLAIGLAIVTRRVVISLFDP